MYILLLCFFAFNIFSGSPFDATVFLLTPDDYTRQFSYGDYLKGGSLFILDTSYYYFSSPSFLSKKCINLQYVQQLTDIAFGLQLDDYLLFKTVFRSRVFWGSGEQGLLLKDSYEIFLDTNLNYHSHDLEYNFFWLREGWVCLDLSRFMCLKRSVNLQIGYIPYEIGRGISYGQAYMQGGGFLGFDPSDVINEFPPGILLTGEFFSYKDSTLNGDIFCSIIHNHSIYLEEILEPIYRNRINNCSDYVANISNDKVRGFGHISTGLIWRLEYEKKINKNFLHIEPYVLCVIIPELNLRYMAQGKSSLCTLGCMIDYIGDKFAFNLEWAINKGGAKIYGWDNNYLRLNNLSSGNLVIENNNVHDDSGDNALASEANQLLINNSPEGACFNGKEIGLNLVNSHKRFTDYRYVEFEGAMFVADFAYWASECLQLATSFGFATGGEDPAYDNDDLSLGAFLGVQQLYTGLYVQTSFGMGGPFYRPVEQDYSSSSSYYETVSRIFSDLKYIGFSVRFDSEDQLWMLQLNILAFWTFISPKSFDFTILKTDKKTVDNFLGTEIFAYFVYKLRDELSFYLAYSIFSPGERYINENAGIFDVFDQYFLNSNSYQNNLHKFNLVYLCNIGFEYDF